VEFDATPLTLPNGPVPMFPLPGVFLFPHQVLPLHIFEPRYRDMVRDLLDGPGRFVIASPQIGERETQDHPPVVVPIGGLGEIVQHEMLPDGRYMIWVHGLARVHIEEVESPHRYRQVECLPFLETEVPAPESADLSRRLREAASARLQEPVPLPDTTPPGLLADLLLQTLHGTRTLVERGFAEPDVAARAQLALDAAERQQPDDEPPGEEV
jgi:Lon protease-like protein